MWRAVVGLPRLWVAMSLYSENSSLSPTPAFPVLATRGGAASSCCECSSLPERWKIANAVVDDTSGNEATKKAVQQHCLLLYRLDQLRRYGAPMNSRCALGLCAIGLVTIPAFPSSSVTRGKSLRDQLVGDRSR
jgi:hypothetical protein